MSGRSRTLRFECFGAFLTALVAAACSSAVPEANEHTATQEDGLGESLASCVDADATAWSDGTLTIDATNSTSGIVIVSPGNSVVKVNGRTCMAGGSKIPLSSVSNIVVNGRANASDTFVLDFSAGLPKTPLLQENGILINGNETVFSSKTPDTVVLRGSAGADVVTAGLNPDISQGEIEIALTPSSKVAHISLVKLGQTAPGPFAPKLVLSLGAGDDTFNGLGDFPDFTPATPVNFGMAIYGGPGNDTLVGGLGGDKIDGGGQASDSLSYVDRTIDPVFVDSGTSKVSVWGGDLRGVTTKVGGKTYIDRGNGSLTAVTFSGEATPASIVAAINGALGANVASTIGNRLRLTSTGSRIVINSTYADDTTAALGLQNGVYENVGNDGAAGAALAVPWKSPSAIAASATAYAVGDVVVPISANGYWYKATVAGTSAGGDPSWSTTLGATVSDGGVTWTTAGRVWKAAVKWAPGDVLYDLGNSAVYEILECTGRTGALTTLAASNGATKVDGGVTWTTRGSTWVANTSYTSGDYAAKTSANGFYYKALNSGTSHATTEPTWPTAIGSTVVDGSVTWVCAGTAPILAGNTQYALGDFVRDASGTLGSMTDSAMLSGNSLPSMGPTHSNVADGDVFWTYQGPLSEGDDVQGVAVLSGGAGNDILVGSSGANTLNGNDGDDILSGGPVMAASLSCPMDKLNGGAGDDWFDMGGDENQPTLKNDCNQTISGGSGLDVVDYSQRSNASILLIKLDGVTASGEQSSTPREADKIGSDVEIALGGAGLDLITGSDNDNYLYGGPGNDRIYGGKGDDHIYGGAGDDFLYGDLGNDTFYELSSFQTSNAWNEPLQGTTWAGLGRSIYGSEKPGAGDDLVMGGSDLTETNKIDFSDAANPVAIAICSDGSAANATLKTCAPGVSDYVQISRDGTTATPGASGTKNSYINVEYVAGSLTQPNVFIGSANSEVFEGGAGVDIILGQGGQDTLSGSPDMASGVSKDNTSIDILCGGDGDDLLSGGTNALLEGEGQMDQAHATQNTTAVRIGGSSSQAPSFCTDPSNAVFSVVRGNNMCFGSNKTHCLN